MNREALPSVRNHARVRTRAHANSVLTSYAGSWDREKAAHLVRRTSFGAIKREVDQALADNSSGAAVKIDGRWGFINTSGSNVVTPSSDAVDDFARGLARLRVDVGEAQRYGYMDRSGRYVWHPTD